MTLRVEFIARMISVLWAGFWLLFFVVESLAWHTPIRLMLMWVALGLLFVLLAVVAWRWEVTGGVLLLIVGLAVGIAYAVSPPPQLPLVAVVITTVVFSVPPLLAGVLFLLHQRSL